jgi:hypothetical protein
MNGVVYQDRSADELRLNLCTGMLDLEQFTILQQGSLQMPFVVTSRINLGRLFRPGLGET